MSFSRKAALALTGLAALAMPLAVAGAASATTTSAGCTVTPLKPVFDHLNSSGNKVIKYDTKVYCDAGRSIEILDERRDQDNFSLDDFEGSIIYNHRFDSAATVTESVQAVLPDADSLAEGADKEEMYHAVGFQSPRTTATSRRGPTGTTARWCSSTCDPRALLGPASGGVAADRPVTPRTGRHPGDRPSPRGPAGHGWIPASRAGRGFAPHTPDGGPVA